MATKKARYIDPSGTAILALDQSTKMIGHSTFLNGDFEASGQFEPDFPKLDNLTYFIKDYLEEFVREGYKPILVAEDIYYGKNVQTFKTLAILMGHIQRAAFDCKAEVWLSTANNALKALTGVVTSPKNPVDREHRKAMIIKAATELAGYETQEDESDSIAVAKAYLDGWADPVM